jgi:hypothetical protein
VAISLPVCARKLDKHVSLAITARAVNDEGGIYFRAV